ncbi:Predicted arabinose efflux permease, MFS family [Microlunatus soli]|uniref:Predicted arabinose efflux permease, MFS family n=2 Tax=Microlunatus soli TaxID=630515 RepID=A0A1H1ZAY7_9ACTN|nr:Predicted arabinose efflux permease, MFS family [Microlunatus soli]
MLLGAMLNPINSSIIAVSLIPIGMAFGAPPAETTWLVSALYLATAVGQPLFGKLVDAFGPRPLYLIGSAMVGVAGVMGMFAPSLGVLIAARVLLGFGTCAGYPASMHLIRRENRRTGQDSPQVVLTLLALSSQTVMAIGPTLGGLLMALGGWRATFAINVPLAVACLVIGSRRLPRREASATRPAVHIDVVGILAFAAVVVPLMIFLIDIRPDRWYLPVIAGLAAVGFGIRELRAAEPFIDLRVLAGNPPLVLTYLRALLTATVSYGLLYGFTQWLEDGRQLAPTPAGLALLPLSGMAIVISLITGRRQAVRAKLMVGAIAQLIACAVMIMLGGGTPYWLLLVVTAVAGVSQGLTGLANQNAVYYQADPRRIASSAGLMRTFVYLGSMVASAAQGAFLKPRADSASMHELATFMIIFAALFLILSITDRSLRRIGADNCPAPAAQPESRSSTTNEGNN